MKTSLRQVSPRHSLNEDRQLVWSMYQEAALGERHFNELQSVYRRIASLWLLATFTGSGFIVIKSSTLSIDPYIAGLILYTSSSCGLFLLWCVDLLVYHRLLDSHFYAALNLERRYGWLPRIRHSMRMTPNLTGLSRGGNLSRVAIFYAIPISILVLASIFCIAAFAISASQREFDSASGFAINALQWVSPWGVGLLGALLASPLARTIYLLLCRRARHPGLADSGGS